MVTTRSRQKATGVRRVVEVGLYAIVFLLIVPLLLSLRLGRGEWHPNFFLFWVIVAVLISGVVLLVRWLRRRWRNRRARH